MWTNCSISLRYMKLTNNHLSDWQDTNHTGNGLKQCEEHPSVTRLRNIKNKWVHSHTHTRRHCSHENKKVLLQFPAVRCDSTQCSPNIYKKNPATEHVSVIWALLLSSDKTTSYNALNLAEKPTVLQEMHQHVALCVNIHGGATRSPGFSRGTCIPWGRTLWGETFTVLVFKTPSRCDHTVHDGICSPNNPKGFIFINWTLKAWFNQVQAASGLKTNQPFWSHTV